MDWASKVTTLVPLVPLKSICVYLAARSVEVKTVYITALSNVHVSNICGWATYIRKARAHGKNGRVVFTTVWLYQFHLWDLYCRNIILRGS